MNLTVITIVNTSDVDRVFAGLDSALDLNGGPVREAVNDCGDIYMGFITDRFDRFSAGSGDWEPLATSTIAAKGKKELGAGVSPEDILRETDAMRKSLDKGGANHVDEEIPDGVRRGTEDPKAGKHQEGEGNIPQRRILVGPDDITLSAIGERLAQGVREAITRALQ